MRALIAASVVLGVAAGAAHAWIVTLDPPHNGALAVAVTGNGDAVAAGATAVARFAAADGTELWRYGLFGAAVAIDGAGDVVAAGDDGASGFTVAKLAGATGAELWRYTIPVGGTAGVAHAVVVDGSGDVIAGGTRFAGLLSSFDFLVVKIAGASGAELWRYQTTGSYMGSYRLGVATALALEPGGDVVAAGELMDEVPPAVLTDLTVIRLAGATGTEIWRAGLPTPDPVTVHADRATAVAVDGAGDVLVAGRVLELGPDLQAVVAKFAGASGAEIWRTIVNGTTGTSLSSDEYAAGMALDAAGDVVIAAGLDNVGTATDFTVLKFAGATGTELWRRSVNGTDDPDLFPNDFANAVVVDPSGDVVAGGYTSAARVGQQMTVMKLAGADGADVWRRDVNGRGMIGVAAGLALDAEGNVLAAGMLGPEFGLGDPQFAVVRLADAVPGASLVVRDSTTNPAAKSLVLSVRSGPEPLVATAGGVADPTIAGATLELFNPTTAETASFPLPAAHWQGLGSPPGFGGYKYLDPARVSGPCVKVTIVGPGRRSNQGPLVRLQARCKGSGIGFSLDEPAQGSLGVILATGVAPSVRACAVFGGTVLQDSSTGGGGTGAFRARAAPASGLGVCP